MRVKIQILWPKPQVRSIIIAEDVHWSDLAPTSRKSDYYQLLVGKRSAFSSLSRRNGRWELQGGVLRENRSG